MPHPKTAAWERELTGILKMVDRELETIYGDRYPLHPARLSKGEAANPQHDGLFSITASFSAGFGSTHGPGYVVEVRMVTLADIPEDIVEQIENEAAEIIRAKLPSVFPGRTLNVDSEGSLYKIHGDLSLGKP